LPIAYTYDVVYVIELFDYYRRYSCRFHGPVFTLYTFGVRVIIVDTSVKILVTSPCKTVERELRVLIFNGFLSRQYFTVKINLKKPQNYRARFNVFSNVKRTFKYRLRCQLKYVLCYADRTLRKMSSAYIENNGTPLIKFVFPIRLFYEKYTSTDIILTYELRNLRYYASTVKSFST